MLEVMVEKRLKTRLEKFGFKVLKLTTPGSAGTPDRLILMPAWSPGPPAAVELKRPFKHERPLQKQVRDDWRRRGVDVRDMCDDYDKVDALTDQLFKEAMDRIAFKGHDTGVPDYFIHEYRKITEYRK